jgi:thioredoxin reductase (NADPH)
VVVQFDLKINTYEPVVHIHRDDSEFLLTTKRGDGEAKYQVKKIVLATGGTERPRAVNVPGHDLPHVSHYFRDPHEYFQKDLLIVGGRNSAVEAALRSHYVGARVSVSYRNAQFDAASIKYWLWPEMNGLIQSGKLKAHFNTTLKEIRPDGAVLTDASGRAIDVAADFVLLLIGYEADMTLCRSAGVELKGAGQMPVFDAATMETNVPGIYVAGTAVGGTQERYAIFIENCHVHAERIMASLTGAAPPPLPVLVEQPES